MLHADLILTNANIVTLNSRQPKAQAVAIKDGKFVAVGTNKEILSYEGKHTKKISLENKTILPGFIDTHAHCSALGSVSFQIDLHDAYSIKEIQKRVKEWTRKIDKDKWIVGQGWDQMRLAERRYPTKNDLDQATSKKPVFLLRTCGHIGVVNSKAMQIAGITKKSKKSKGGEIGLSTETGEPNGILEENALDLIYGVMPKPSEEELANMCLLACRRMVEEGITTVHWIINSKAEIRTLNRMCIQEMLPLRIYLLIPVEFLDEMYDLGFSTGFGSDKMKIGSVKILADGSLGGRTAALKKPYDDAPDARGIMVYERRKLEELVLKAHEAGFQLAIHVIGDKAIETILEIFEKVLSMRPKKDHRHRLEHSSVLNPRLIKKMKELKVVAAVQPHFVVSDFWLTERLGKSRARWTYAFKSLLKEGVMIMGSSDAPTEPLSPVLGIWAATSRETSPQERLTVDEALRLYTINAAYGSFEDHLKGTIEEGKLADLVLVSHDPHKASPQQIKEIKVEMTIIGGKTVFTLQQ